MFGDKLVQKPLNEQLKSHSLDDIAEQDHVFTLTDYGYVFLFDRRRFLKVRGEDSTPWLDTIAKFCLQAKRLGYFHFALR